MKVMMSKVFLKFGSSKFIVSKIYCGYHEKFNINYII